MSNRKMVLGLLAALMIGACSQQEADEPYFAPVDETAQPTTLEMGEWVGFPNADSARINGSVLAFDAQGGAMIPVRNDGAQAGDTIAAYMTLTAAAAGRVRVVLYRHCNSDLGDEGDSREIEVSTTSTAVQLRHTFSQAYECVRVQVYSTGQPSTVTIRDLMVTKEP